MLLAAIDENHRGTYDFLYLPIDFKVMPSGNIRYHILQSPIVELQLMLKLSVAE